MKYEVTPELSQLIKSFRVQNKIAGNNLAAHIGKNPVYISKLENGGIKNIEENELIQILDYVVRGDDFFEDKLPLITSQCALLCDTKDMMRQFWLINLDAFVRPVKVPKELVESFRQSMSALNITGSELIKLINDSPGEIFDDSTLKNSVNRYRKKNTEVSAVRIYMTENDLERMLDEETPCSNYSFIHSVAYTLYRLTHYGRNSISAKNKKDIWLLTEFDLNNFGITKQEAYARLMLPEFLVKQEEFDEKEEQKSLQLVRAVIDVLGEDYLSRKEVQEHSDIVIRNLEWDKAFMTKLLAFPFYELNSASYSFKKQLLEDISRLLEDYKNRPESEKMFDVY